MSVRPVRSKGTLLPGAKNIFVPPPKNCRVWSEK